MKKSIFLWQIAGFLFVSLMGTLLHFAYDWGRNNVLLAPFSAVNESILEHMKILFFPMLVFSVIEYRNIGRGTQNFWCVKLIGITAGLLAIPILYYTYTGALGAFAHWFNIAIFFIAAALGFFAEAKLLNKNLKYCLPPRTSVVLLCIIALVFAILTFFPPHIPLFEDPMTRTYGIEASR